MYALVASALAALGLVGLRGFGDGTLGLLACWVVSGRVAIPVAYRDFRVGVLAPAVTFAVWLIAFAVLLDGGLGGDSDFSFGVFVLVVAFLCGEAGALLGAAAAGVRRWRTTRASSTRRGAGA